MFHGTEINLPSVRFPSRTHYYLLPSNPNLFPTFNIRFRTAPYGHFPRICLYFAAKIAQKKPLSKDQDLRNRALNAFNSQNSKNLFSKRRNGCSPNGKTREDEYTVLYRPADQSSPFHTVRTVKRTSLNLTVLRPPFITKDLSGQLNDY
jgi:hypothetical protein